MKDLIAAYFKRDLSDAELGELAAQVMRDDASAAAFMAESEERYIGFGLPLPGEPHSGFKTWAHRHPWALSLVSAGLGALLVVGIHANQDRLSKPASVMAQAAGPGPVAAPRALLANKGASIKPAAPTPTAMPKGEKTGTVLSLAIDLKVRKRVLIDVLDQSGRRVARVVDGEYGPGVVKFPWEGEDRAGKKLAPGRYKIVMDYGQGVMEREITISANE